MAPGLNPGNIFMLCLQNHFPDHTHKPKNVNPPRTSWRRSEDGREIDMVNHVLKENFGTAYGEDGGVHWTKNREDESNLPH